jgi:hypothetical protein
MTKKMMLLALAAVSAAMFALPAVASAGEPVIDPASGKFPLTFTSAGGHSELRANEEPPITCTSNTGTGKYTSGTTGEIALTFHGCTTSFFGFPVSCNSAGQPSGTIKTNTSVFHNVYVTDAKTNPGVLVTPPTSPAGLYTTIICGGFASIEVRGNGIIGELTSPKCGAVAQKTATLNFAATGSSQTLKKVTATGTEYSLSSTTESSGKVTTSCEVAEGTVTYAENATLTCV